MAPDTSSAAPAIRPPARRTKSQPVATPITSVVANTAPRPTVRRTKPQPAVSPVADLAPALTLAIDIGGTGLKAAVLDESGAMKSERVRIETTYPMTPTKLVEDLTALVKTIGAFDRISAGFPGVVRDGLILSAPHFITKTGPGSKIDPKLVDAWRRFDLAAALTAALGKPARLANDADLQGCAVVSGKGLELVITLGTGCGTAVFRDGHSSIHLELAHHPFRNGQTYDEQLGEPTRKKISAKKWNMRVAKAIAILDALFLPDHIYIGGGNAIRLKVDLPAHATTVDNTAGILGGIKLWDSDAL
jgi:polyphosphate glucokinase